MNTIEEKVKEIAVKLLKDNLLITLKPNFKSSELNYAIDCAFDYMYDPYIRELIENNFDINSNIKEEFLRTKLPDYCDKFIKSFEDDNTNYFDGLEEVRKHANEILKNHLSDAVEQESDIFVQDIFNNFYNDIERNYPKEFVEFVKLSCDFNSNEDDVVKSMTKKHIDKLIESIKWNEK